MIVHVVMVNDCVDSVWTNEGLAEDRSEKINGYQRPLSHDSHHQVQPYCARTYAFEAGVPEPLHGVDGDWASGLDAPNMATEAR